MSTVSRIVFDKAVNLIQEYDPYFDYIDDGGQWEQARKNNLKINKEFSALVKELGINFEFIPFDASWVRIGEVGHGKKYETLVDWIKENLIKWFNERGFDVEKKEEPPQQQKRVWTEDEIRSLVQTNDTVLYGALKKLYACQTDDEQRVGETKEYNGVGFNGCDARILSSMAEFLKKTGFLTEKQKVIARKKMVKYTKQLTRLANA